MFHSSIPGDEVQRDIGPTWTLGRCQREWVQLGGKNDPRKNVVVPSHRSMIAILWYRSMKIIIMTSLESWLVRGNWPQPKYLGQYYNLPRWMIGWMASITAIVLVVVCILQYCRFPKSWRYPQIIQFWGTPILRTPHIYEIYVFVWKCGIPPNGYLYSRL